MDNLKTLMDKRQYQLVVKLTESSLEPTSLFYRISALLALGKGEDALTCIKTNQTILEVNMAMLMRIHIEILCLLTKFDEAYETLEYYKNRPYVSQEVEELIKELPKMIRLEEKKNSSMRFIKDEDLIKKLESDDSDTVLMAIDVVRERDINLFLDYLQNVMLKFPQQSIRSLALLLLVQKKVNKMMKFNHTGEVIDINPSLLEPPFVGDNFNQIVKELDQAYRNPVISENALQILSTHLIYIYPISMHVEIPVLLEALFQVTTEYLKSDENGHIEERCQEKKLDADEVKKLISEIKNSLDHF